MASLYTLTGELLDIKKTLLERYESDDQIIEDTIDGEAMDYDQKCLGYAYVIKEKNALADAKEKLALEMLDEVKKERARADRMNDVLFKSLLATGREVNGEHFTLSIKGKPKKLIVDDEAVPEEYKKTVVKESVVRDNDKIKAALDSGIALAWAHYDSGKKLVIK